VIEHEPWVGSEFDKLGLNGQRIAIVGYSHHRAVADDDSATFTIREVRDVISGKETGGSLFAPVTHYFGFDDKGAFLSRVMFFNYLPDCIGTTDEKYGYGTKEQINRAQERFLRIIRKRHPHKVLVFTAKGWSDFPPTREKQTTNALLPLGLDFPKSFSWGTYDADRHVVMAFGLRHPQYAKGDLMRKAVQLILAMPRV
jgi:hypothetical protein